MNKRKLQVLEILDSGYYKDDVVSGSTVDVMLTDGRVTVLIEDILDFDEEQFFLEDFDEAVTLAREGEEGYSIVE